MVVVLIMIVTIVILIFLFIILDCDAQWTVIVECWDGIAIDLKTTRKDEIEVLFDCSID